MPITSLEALRISLTVTLNSQEDHMLFLGKINLALRIIVALPCKTIQLTDNEFFLSFRWGLYLGDADCFNDQNNVKKPGTYPAGWSDGATGTIQVYQSLNQNNTR